ncbi:MAG: GNAT family N-acetyltransferase [Rhodobacteraceae bacterium]|nr:GNAT family N-acetyltransferase [Paracoccaceae bacterium]
MLSHALEYNDEYVRIVRHGRARMSQTATMTVRLARFPEDLDAVRRLWLEYLTWGSSQMQSRHGVHLHSPAETVEQDLAAVGKYQPPQGCLVLVFRDGQACGVGCLHRIGDGIGEIKRMYVDPSLRRLGAGRAILDHLLTAARNAGYTKVRLDSADFLAAAHALYRSVGFKDIEPYPESELPEQFRQYLVFMERDM